MTMDLDVELFGVTKEKRARTTELFHFKLGDPQILFAVCCRLLLAVVRCRGRQLSTVRRERVGGISGDQRVATLEPTQIQVREGTGAFPGTE